MAKLSFQTLNFSVIDTKLVVTYLKLFYFEIENSKLEKIGNYNIINNNTIEFIDAKQDFAEKKFSQILAEGFNNLKNKLNGKPTIYIHRNSAIPLLGTLFIGIADKNVTTIEVKPMTSCNTDCIFCSVDLTRRSTDFVVEKEYLVQEVQKLVDFKQSNYIEINVNPHGEPTLYADLVGLVFDLKQIPQIKSITMNTNGSLLTKSLMDKLLQAGMTRVNVSLHSLDSQRAKVLFNTKTYDVNRVKESCRYLASKNALLIAPVLVTGYNDDDMGDLIEFAKEINAPIRIQNYQIHTQGKKPKKTGETSWDNFFEKLKELEKKHNVTLIGEFPGFILKKTKVFPQPFTEGQLINAKIMSPGSFNGDVIAVAENRAISVQKCSKKSGIIKLKITRAKYNTFFGEIIN